MVIRPRAQVPWVNTSAPNFNGTRVSTGRKYSVVPVGRKSVDFDIADLVLYTPKYRAAFP
jgi:hypothetical protein